MNVITVPIRNNAINTQKKENPQTKSIRFNAEFLEYRKESLENIESDQEIEEKLNRSIQAEGMFSKIKEGLEYNRFRHRGLKNIKSDINLLILGLNLNQLHKN